ncbi:MAG: hypothetical protein AB8H86_19845 [Polyangiales bacterium]
MALRALWTLPTNLVGHGLGRLLCRTPPKLVEGPAARGSLYRLPKGVPGIGAIALGSAILYDPRFVHGRKARSIITHELAHTRQHDCLGPLYLPMHIVCQGISVLLSVVTRRRSYSLVHGYNPLEQRWICLGVGHIDGLAHGTLMSPDEAEAFFDKFGLGQSAWRSLGVDA